MKRKVAAVLCVALFAVTAMACGKGDKTESEATTPSSAEVTEETTLADAQPTEEVVTADGIRSALTNEAIDEAIYKQRPITVMFNNLKAACPQTSISKAGVVYEVPVEGSITRLMGVIEDWQGLDKIGSVRSSRDYYIYWAKEWDSLYVHFGGPAKFINPVLEKLKINNINGLEANGDAYYRTTDRVAPHNAYAKGSGLAAAAGTRGYSLTYEKGAPEVHFTFASDAAPNMLESGVAATHVEMGGYNINHGMFDYNAEDGLYYRSQYGAAQIDDLDGKQLTCKNIIIINVDGKVRDSKGRLKLEVVDSGKTGYFITNGKAIPITWDKVDDTALTKYYDEQGNEIQLNTGKTWICVVLTDNKDKTVIQ